MPRGRKRVEPDSSGEKIRINPELLDELIPGPMSREGFDGMFRELKKRLLERALGAELTDHLGYSHGEAPPEGCGNTRNGKSSKTVLTDDGPLHLETPRDRAGTFEPQLIGKHERRFTGFDDRIISLYARGMTVRDIQKHLLEMYGVDVSPQLISTVTEEVMEEVREWQSRPLEPLYAVVFFDCLRAKIRDEGTVKNKAVYVALGVLPDGSRDILGLWIEQNEGAKFWLKAFNELRNRGLEDILIVVVDGLKGFPEAIEAAFPHAMVQTCIVHLIRNSLAFVNWKDRKTLMKALRPVYTAATEDGALLALEAFEDGCWGAKYPTIPASWRRSWEQVRTFFAFPMEIRKIIYTTNAIESLNMRLRRVIKTRGHFPSDDAALKLLWLALRNITAGWRSPSREWRAAMNQFAIMFPERFRMVGR